MRVQRIASFAVLSAGSLVLSLSVACGGASSSSPGAASPGSGANVDPAAAATGASGPNGAAGDPSAAATNVGAPSTTTTTLGDGGDLQGAKLQQTNTGSGATAAFDAGPARGAHEQEAGRTPRDIQTIVQAHRDEARACYDKVQQAHPDYAMKGNLDVRWTIDPKGNVTEITVDDAKSDIHDPNVSKCVMDVIRPLHFSVSAKGFETRAHYPFNFNPKQYTGKTQGQ